MKYVTYKGSLYSKVTERIKAVKALNRPYSLTTTEETVSVGEFVYWKVRAELIMLDTHEVYTGLAMRRYEMDHPFGKYALEWAETVATARAIGKMGIGIDYAYACLEELGDLDSSQVKERDGGTVPKVELDKGPESEDEHKFTKEDMKTELGVNEEPVREPEPEPEPAPEPVEIPQAPPITKAEKLAAQLAAKKEITVKPPKPGKTPKVVKLPVEPEPAPNPKPDKLDRALEQIEKAEPKDPIFGDDEPNLPEIPEEPIEVPSDTGDDQSYDGISSPVEESPTEYEDIVIDLD